MNLSAVAPGSTTMQREAAKAIVGSGRTNRTQEDAARLLGISQPALCRRLDGFRSHVLPEYRSNFDRALSRGRKRRRRAGPYVETAAA